ncbi:ABC transporter permease [Paenibacillus sp. J2TS4]|uniref:ABC transporter permease n=1 Tax=Paenibacillus sp. J2TS4 TaxID=2807194 RepID=UPI001B14093B|nr:ABC transporter permease [Paenibacillus sp. J2TS4]GIP35121.1 transport permease protein [Paenibacillus sp. J2TS4]
MYNILRLLNPVFFIKQFWINKSLIKQFTQREILLRYKGSFLGFFWSFINPLLMLSVYTFVFSVVFKGRWGLDQPENNFEFAMIMFCGIIAFNIFSETVNRAPTLIVGNVNYVKKVVFPLEILPITVLLSNLIHAGISVLTLLLAVNIFLHFTTWTIILIFIVIVPLIFLTLGISWFLSSLGVYIRDIAYTVVVATNILFYVTPIFYPINAVPDFFKTFMFFNPMTTIVDNFRRVIIWGKLPDWSSYFIILLVSYIIMIFGYLWFNRTRKGFADVL